MDKRLFQPYTEVFTSDGTAKTVTVGFKATRVEIMNLTDGDARYIWVTGMTAATAYPGVSSNGVTVGEKTVILGTSVMENLKSFAIIIE